MNTRVSALLTAFATSTAALLAQSNIDNSIPNKFAWSESAGWTNWRDANGAADGVIIGDYVLSGFVWGENIGWIKLGDGTPAAPPFYANATGLDFGVNIDADGDLHGFAWGENVGWINFDGGAMAAPAQPARIECTGRFTGYAWGENIGWINLSIVTAGQFVAVEPSFVALLCDVNHDSLKNGRDVQSFVNVLLAGGNWRDTCSGDVQALPSGEVDIADIPPFISCLLE